MKLLIYISILLALMAAQTDAAGLLSDQITLYDSFDNSVAPIYTVGVATAAGNYLPIQGRIGHAIQSQDAQGVRFQSQLNLDQSIGTLSFWFKPDESYFDRKTANGQMLFSLANSNFQIVANPADQVIFFMTGTQLPEHDFEWDYASQFGIGKLSADRWTNIAITWNATTGDKQIFLDGKSVSKSNTPLMRRGSIDSEMHFASAPGSYDELAIWNRVLSDAEIAAIANDPASLATAVAALPRDVDNNPWQIYPGLVYTTFTQALLEPDKRFRIKIPFTNRQSKPTKAKVIARCIDIWDQPAGNTIHFEIELQPGETQKVPVELLPGKLGDFRVEVQVESGGFKRARDVTCFAVLPAGVAPYDPFFGAHVNAGDDIPEACRELGIASNRVHNMTQFTWWSRMQPTPDRWAMIGAEMYDQYSGMGYTHLGQWFAVPNWAAYSADGKTPAREDGYPSGWIPGNVEALRAYIRESLKRFPAITEWEIWNEPHVSMFWYGSPKQYVELCAIIYEEAKKARPDIIVYAQVNPEGPWARTAFESGVMEHCDGISFHYYANADGDPQGAAQMVGAVRELIKKYSKKDPLKVPMIQSEGAVVGSTFLRGLDFPNMVAESRRDPLIARQAAEMYVKTRVVLLSCGVKHDYYYLANPFPPPLREDFSLFDVTNGPKPKAVALNQLIWQIDSGSFDRQIDGLPDGLRVYLFHRKDEKALAVLFAENGAKFQLPWLGDCFDLMGNALPHTAAIEVSATPIYVHLADSKVQLTAASVKMMTPASATAQATIAGPKRMDDFPVAAELGKDRLLPVDLSAVVNAPLADDDAKHGWTSEGSFNDGRMIPNGSSKWLGIPTLIAGKTPADKSVITLFGHNTPTAPKSVVIPMHYTKSRGLFFMHAASWADGQLGDYVINYDDGKEVVLPIKVGENIGDWWTDQMPDEQSRTVAFRHPDPLQADKPYRFVRIWYWENPRSDVAIRSVTIHKSSSTGNLVLLALTRASW